MAVPNSIALVRLSNHLGTTHDDFTAALLLQSVLDRAKRKEFTHIGEIVGDDRSGWIFPTKGGFDSKRIPAASIALLEKPLSAVHLVTMLQKLKESARYGTRFEEERRKGWEVRITYFDEGVVAAVVHAIMLE